MLFLFLFFSIIFAKDDFFFGDDVEVLTTKTFKKRMGEEDHFLVLFYQFSPYSQPSVPVIRSLAKKLENDLKIAFNTGVVNCQNDETVCKEYKVMASQKVSLKYFREGVDYRQYGKEVSSADNIFDWIHLVSRETINSVTSLGELKDLMEEFPNLSFLIQLYHPSSPPDVNIRKIADFMDEIVVVTVDRSLASDKLFNKLRIKKKDRKNTENAFFVYRAWKRSYKKLKAKNIPKERDLLVSELFEFGFPPVSEVNELSLNRMGTIGGRISCILFFDYDNFDQREKDKLLEGSTEVAIKVKGKASFGYADSNDDYFRIYTNIGGTEDELPNIGCIDLETQKRFVFHGDVYSAEDIEYFVDQIFDKELEEAVKSETFPSQNEPTYKIVASTYNDVVFKSHKNRDIVIMFYRESDAAQASVKGNDETVMEKVADYYRNMAEKVTIAKFDVTKNDIVDKNINIDKLPYLVMYAKGKRKSPKVFHGDMEKSELISFIEKNAVALKEKMDEL